jgi:predicted ATPase
LHGWAIVEQAEFETGIAEMEKGLSAFRAISGGFLEAYYRALFAEQYGKRGDVKKGLTLVNEGITLVEQSGEGWCEAELFRIRGQLLHIQGEVIAAENDFRHAIAIAQKQEAKLLELRAALSLARLWPTHLCPADVKQQITSLYEWFSEGLDLPDLIAARAFIEEL